MKFEFVLTRRRPLIDARALKAATISFTCKNLGLLQKYTLNFTKVLFLLYFLETVQFYGESADSVPVSLANEPCACSRLVSVTLFAQSSVLSARVNSGAGDRWRDDEGEINS